MSGRKRAWTYKYSIAAAAVIFILSCIALCLGRYAVTPRQIVSVLFPGISGGSETSSTVRNVVLAIRIPRILGALICGGGLAAAGAGFQAVFSNPLATPDTLGVGTAASFGAVLAILIGLPSAGIRIAALASGMTAIAAVSLICGKRDRADILMLVLSGMVAAAMFQALTSLVKYIADPQDKLPAITYWLLGSLKGMSWEALALTAALIIPACTVLIALRWKLDALSLGGEQARALGIPVELMRWISIAASSLITAAVVSACGQIGWIGLLIPHMSRMLFGGSNRNVIPASIAFGAVFLLVTDTIARSATAAEIPAALITAVIGAPLFIILLKRTGGMRL